MVNNPDCIVAFHIGHSYIERSEARKDMIVETCCGGVMLLDFCPRCGEEIIEKKKYEKWQKIARKKEVKEKIKYYKEEKDPSNFMKGVLESYKEELIKLNDVLRGADE